MDESVIGWERSEVVCVQGIGWKGVGVGEGFGATVTNTNGRSGCADAFVLHPASRNAAMIVICQMGFMGRRRVWWVMGKV